MVEERKQTNINVMQNIVLENREKLNVTGINDILSFSFNRFRYAYNKRFWIKNKQIKHRWKRSKNRGKYIKYRIQSRYSGEEKWKYL